MEEKFKDVPFYELVNLVSKGRERVISNLLREYNQSKNIDDFHMKVLAESSHAINVTLKQIVHEEWDEIKISDLNSVIRCASTELYIRNPTWTDEKTCEKVGELFEGRLEISLDKKTNKIVVKTFANAKNAEKEEVKRIVH